VPSAVLIVAEVGAALQVEEKLWNSWQVIIMFVVIGTILMGVSLFGILGYLLFALGDLLREAQAGQEVTEQTLWLSVQGFLR
jgi:hypothetical protein